jgi:hypothetical protein
MAKSRLYRGTIKMGVAFPEAFANWQTPVAAELNNSSYSFDLTPALVETGTKFDLAASTADSTLTFASTAGYKNLTFYQPTIVLEFNRSTSPTAVDQANTAYQLLQFPDTDYFGWVRIGKDPSLPFVAGDRVSMIHFTTDWPVENIASGKNVTMTSTGITQGDIIWQYLLAA